MIRRTVLFLCPEEAVRIHTGDEILAKIAELKAASPSDAAGQFAALEAAAGAYFAPDDELTHKVKYTIHQMFCDVMTRNTVYEHQELLPAFREDYPAGYDNVLELFDGGGLFEEILAASAPAVAATFSPDEEGLMASPLLGSWITKAGAARGALFTALEKVAVFCEGGGYNYGSATLFEELGDVTSEMKTTELADRVFVQGGYQELIETLGLDMHIPSYLKGGER